MTAPVIGQPLFGVQLSSGGSATGLPPGTPNAPPIDVLATINDLATRLAHAERQLRFAVSGDNVLASIILTPEDALIGADRISLVGEVNFLDWHRDITGAVTPTIDPSLTQIRGGVIRTQKILSFDGLSWLDLDATGTGSFLKSHSAIDIRANGTFTFGGGSSKALVFDGTDLTIGADTVITSGSTIGGVSGTAAAALAGLSDKLNRNASDTLAGVIAIQASSGAGIKVGTITWDNSGNLTGGTGVAITTNGIVGAASGVAKFVLKADGTATFAGELSAATGTFAGDISTSGSILATGLVTSGGLSASVIGSRTSGSVSDAGLLGFVSFSGGYGIHGVATHASAFGGVFYNTQAGGLALWAGQTKIDAIAEITGQLTLSVASGAPMSVSSTTKVANLNVDLLDGKDWASPAAIGTGTPAAATFANVDLTSASTLKLRGSGGNLKTLQVSTTAFAIVNNAGTTEIMNLTDAGALTVAGGIDLGQITNNDSSIKFQYSTDDVIWNNIYLRRHTW